jgi:uncharacterized protein (TIGR03663 family)
MCASETHYNAVAILSLGFEVHGKTLSAAKRQALIEPDAVEWEQESAGDAGGWAWTLASGAILLVGAFLRFYELALKPLHHDEGVNGFFLQRLANEGIYHYDPANYHGPTLYYLTLVSTSVNSFFHGNSGLSTVAVRLVPALFGVATIWLVLCLRRHTGALAALFAAAMLAVSPGAVFMSRYFIHESLFTFFTLGIVVAWLKYADAPPLDEARERFGLLGIVAAWLKRINAPPVEDLRERIGAVMVMASAALLVLSTLGAVYRPAYYRLEIIVLLVSLVALLASLWLYDGERSTYLILASVSAALLFATKETAMISAGVLIIAAVSAVFYVNIRQPPPVETKKRKQKHQRRKSGGRATGSAGEQLRRALEGFGGTTHVAVLLLAALAIFLTVGAVFYSSFFTNAKGVGDAFETFKVWAKTGVKDHAQVWYKYVIWLVLEESPTLALGVAGIALALWRAPSRFIVATALWAFGIVAAYSLIPYKTPWLMLNFIVPLAIIGGYAVETFYRMSDDLMERAALIVLTVAALSLGAYQAVALNFRHYDDDRYVYVYAHTVRGFLALVDDIHRAAKQSGSGTEVGITVTSPDYWPLPWYLRDYHKVGYFGRMTVTSEPIIICNEGQEPELRITQHIDERYRRINAYPLRPGVVLVLYVRRDIQGEQGSQPGAPLESSPQ